MTPDLLCRQANHVLRLLAGQADITKNPAEIAAVLRTAAQACSEVENHNSLVKILANAGRPTR